MKGLLRRREYKH